MHLRSGLITLVIATGAIVPALASESTPLVPHRAIYDLKLDRVRGNKPVSDVQGRLSLEFAGNACEGYATKFRQVTRIVDADGGARVTDLKSTTWESGEGTTYKFQIATEVNGNVVQQSEGQAERASDGGVSIDIRRPSPSRSDMDGEAVFPTAHVSRLIQTAKAGGRMLEIRLYDGSDAGDKMFHTTGLIGARVPADGRKTDEAVAKAGFADVPRWPVTISYFEPGPGERTPVLVMSYDLYENGISGALRLDFGEFTLKSEMSRLEVLPVKEGCAK